MQLQLQSLPTAYCLQPLPIAYNHCLLLLLLLLTSLSLAIARSRHFSALLGITRHYSANLLSLGIT
jgi:hypothetical protein